MVVTAEVPAPVALGAGEARGLSQPGGRTLHEPPRVGVEGIRDPQLPGTALTASTRHGGSPSPHPIRTEARAEAAQLAPRWAHRRGGAASVCQGKAGTARDTCPLEPNPPEAECGASPPSRTGATQSRRQRHVTEESRWPQGAPADVDTAIECAFADLFFGDSQQESSPDR